MKLRYGPIFVFHMDEKSYYLPNFSNIAVFETDHAVSHFKKRNSLNNLK